MKNQLLTVIKDWAEKNKKSFWKYEVSSFYATYKISIGNMPAPNSEDVKIQPDSRLFTDASKNQLCTMIKKISKQSDIKNNSNTNVTINYNYKKGAVVADFIS